VPLQGTANQQQQQQQQHRQQQQELKVEILIVSTGF